MLKTYKNSQIKKVTFEYEDGELEVFEISLRDAYNIEIHNPYCRIVKIEE